LVVGCSRATPRHATKRAGFTLVQEDDLCVFFFVALSLQYIIFRILGFFFFE